MMGLRAPWKLLLAGVVLFYFTTNVHSCPSVCQCTTKNGHLTVTCAGRGLSEIPADIPADIYTLDLCDNYIQDITVVFQASNETRNAFENLQILRLSNNSIKSLNDSTFSSLSNLHVLDLSYNDIRKVSDKAFSGLDKLIQLNLRGNKELTTTNDTFHPLISTENLDLSQTGISIDDLLIPPSTLQLRLSENSIGVFKSFFFENLENLQFLDLSRNNLSQVEFSALQSLQILNLSQNNIQQISLGAFNGVTNLLTLILDFNPILQITGQTFQPLSHLQYLSLSQMTKMEYLDKDTLRGLYHLTELQMSNNPHLEFLHVSLFSDLVNAKKIDLSFNNITALHPIMFNVMGAVTMDITGNHLPCDCSIQWIIENNNSSKVKFVDGSNIKCYLNNEEKVASSFNVDALHCGEISVSSNTTHVATKMGLSTTLHCDWTGNPAPLLTWFTPRGKKLYFYPSHSFVERSHPSPEDVSLNGFFHAGHTWHESNSYDYELAEYSDRVVVLNNGDLFIDYMLRTDTGVYKCIAESSQNSTSVEITLIIDQMIFNEIILWSFLIGLACAASFFTLNLIYVVITALVRRCINQRRRDAIVKLVENMDQYKSAQLARLKDNYYSQLNRIREGYHNQLERIRDNYTSQTMRFKSGASQRREWASNKVDTLRDNYNSQVTRLKENSAQKLEHLRDTYNNQLFKIRDYGSTQMARIHKKYKIKQRHVMKLLETMNFDNCRMIIDSECVRAESMIFDTNLIHPDLGFPTPPQTDSDTEYQTATSGSNSANSSHVDLCDEGIIISPSSQTVDINLHHTMEINSSQSMGDNSIPVRDDNSDNDGDTEDMYDCEGELDQMLVQIQMIDESDNESDKNENSQNIESCV